MDIDFYEELGFLDADSPEEHKYFCYEMAFLDSIPLGEYDNVMKETENLTQPELLEYMKNYRPSKYIEDDLFPGTKSD